MENIFIGAQIDRKIYIPFSEIIIMSVKKFLLFGVFIFLIYSALSKEEKTILIDFSHSSNKEQAQKNLSTFLYNLEEKNFEVEMSDVKLESLSLRDYDVLLLWAPSGILEDKEISLILEFVEKGGGLVVNGDWNVSWKKESRDSYNKLVRNFGFKFQENAVDDRTNKAGCKCTPIIHVFESLEEESGIGNVVFAKPCSIEIVGDARAIALGDEDTFVTGKESTEKISLAVVSEYGKGKVVGVGTYHIFENRYILMYDTLEFVLNLVEWVSQESLEAGFGFLSFLILFFSLYLLKKRA
ncbi:MAG: DUF4350 domain-containing protein [Candidatus Methanofastidiosia archaeon]